MVSKRCNATTFNCPSLPVINYCQSSPMFDTSRRVPVQLICTIATRGPAEAFDQSRSGFLLTSSNCLLGTSAPSSDPANKRKVTKWIQFTQVTV